MFNVIIKPSNYLLDKDDLQFALSLSNETSKEFREKPFSFYVRVSFSSEIGLLENGVFIWNYENEEAKICSEEDYNLSSEE